jgi:CheY-like chemotaxis protein
LQQRVENQPPTVDYGSTGWGQEEDRHRSQEAGFNYHLTKPVDPATLTKLLAEIPDAARK